jgi:hypothetical protein
MPQSLIMWVTLWSETSHGPAARHANREIVTIYFSPDGSPDAVDSAGAVVISGGDCIISSSRRIWSCL